MLKDNPSVTNVTAPFTQRSLSRPKILDVAINRATKPLGEEKSLIVNVNQIRDLGRFDMGIVTQIKDLDKAPSVLPKQATAYECTPSLCR